MTLAAILERDGEAVRLILLDSSLHAKRPRAAAAIGRWLLANARPGVRRDPHPDGGALLSRLRRRLSARSAPAWVPRGQIAYATRMVRLGARYRPGPFAGPTLLIRAALADPVDSLFDTDGLMGWSGVLRGPVRQVTVAGGHHQFLREPLVAATADAVADFLGETA